MAKVNWNDNAEVLGWFREKNSRGRRMLEKLGLILSEKVVRIGRNPTSPFTSPTTYADVYVEIETPYAVCAFTMLSHGGEMDAVVMKDADVAFLGGTWRKHRHIVGHAVPYIESQVFPVSGRPIKRTSKKVFRSAPITAYLMAAMGHLPTDDLQAGDKVYLKVRKALDESEAEIAVEHARETLAKAGESVTA